MFAHRSSIINLVDRTSRSGPTRNDRWTFIPWINFGNSLVVFGAKSLELPSMHVRESRALACDTGVKAHQKYHRSTQAGKYHKSRVEYPQCPAMNSLSEILSIRLRHGILRNPETWRIFEATISQARNRCSLESQVCVSLTCALTAVIVHPRS